MIPYIAPLEDMEFALAELSEIDRVAELPDSDSVSDRDLMVAILDQAARFAGEVLAPLNQVGDRVGARWTENGVTTPPGFADAYRQFTEAGWNNIALPVQYGGQGLPGLLCVAVQEMFTSANKAFCYCSGLTEAGAIALASSADEAVKSEYVPKLVAGQWSATMNLTEPQAGSDVGGLTTRALLQPDGTYRIHGQKIFISYGDHDFTENIVHLVLARISGSPAGSRGISLFVVPKILPQTGARNDVRCTGIEHKLGNHGSPTCTLVFGADGGGAQGWLVGSENKGLQAMFVMVNAARMKVGQEGTAMSERAYQQALAYARERIQGKLAGSGEDSVAIIRHPDVRRMLMMMRSQTEAMRAVGYLIAGARDLAARHPDSDVRRERQAFVDLMIPIFKGWATETGIEVTSLSIQIHGGIGYIEESGASQPLRDVRVSAIYEGTTSIQAHDLVERKLVRDGGAALRAWLSEVHRTLHQLRESKESEHLESARYLVQAVSRLEHVCAKVLADYARDPLPVLAVSVPLLRMFGLVVGGWQMARAGLAARRKLAEGIGNVPFLRAKIASATFYAVHVLPQAMALSVVVEHGGSAALSSDDLWR